MAAWDDLPEPLRTSGLLDALQGPLSAVTTTPWALVTENGTTWKRRTATASLSGFAGGAIDPATGRIGSGGDTPIELAGDSVVLAEWRRLSGTTLADPEDGAWRVDLDVPGVRVLLPFLRGARLAGDGMLEEDPDHTQVRLLVPRLVMRLAQSPGGSVGFELLSATTSGEPLDDVYSCIEMSPPYALVGPGAVVGFAFRAAVLDLSGESGPAGVPAQARAMPAEWQGFYLPEARLFVQPDGLDGIAVSAGVRNLWIGLGVHAGVTGTFSAEVVNRGGAPSIMARFITPSGRHVAAIADGEVEVPTGSTFVADTNGGTAPVTITITGGGPVTNGRTTVTVPAAGAVTLTVTAASSGGQSATASFRARRPAAAEGAGNDATNPVQLTNTAPEAGRLVLVRQDATTATLALDPPVAASWTWSGGGSAASATEVTVPVGDGATVTVSATRPASSALVMDAYLRFDHPTPDEATNPTWTTTLANIGTSPAANRTSAPGGTPFATLAADRHAAFTAAAGGGAGTVTVTGYASCESDTEAKRTYNQELSERRAAVVAAVLRNAGYPVGTVSGLGHVLARDGVDPRGTTPVPAPTAPDWWWVRVTGPTPATPAAATARLTRQPRLAVVDRDPAPPTTGRPDCFRRIGVEVELLRSTFVRCEIWGEFDVETALETSLAQGGVDQFGVGSASDGICLFRVRLKLASDRGAWEVFGEFRAAQADLDGLYDRRLTPATAPDTALSMAGAFAVMAPISAAVATLSPAAGALIQLGSVALGAVGWIDVRALTIHGGEIVVSNGVIAPDGSTASTGTGAVSVMLDVEVQFAFDFSVVKVPRDKPVRTRYQAVGVRAAWDPTGPAVPIPVFDASRGYELEIKPGSIQAVEPLDEILRIMGVRVSRDNPTYLEVEAMIGVELGPVTIDTVRVRQRLNAPEPPQLTKLGASLDIPSTLHGSGTLEILPNGFKASIDLTIIPVSIRAAASLALITENGVTGLLIGIEVEFPVPLLLGNSGLGIFGFLGGVGINFARSENPNAALPALDWVGTQLARGSVMHVDGWHHQPGSYAFAAGMLVGTIEGGYVVHLKGILLIEVPGPRLLLIMKADVLKKMPSATSQESATFLAVLDIDFGRGTITLGVVADYTIEKILQVHVPVTAFFSTKQPETWRVDLGTYHDRIRVKVLDVLEASGYLMVHGNGLTGGSPSSDVPPLPGASGVAIATGFHLQAVLMGSKPARLYVEVAAGFDAILGFDPFYLAGRIYIRGELMLFIVSIGVTATLDLAVGKRVENGREVDHPYVHGKVCGKVSFFFFDIEACIELTIGSAPSPDLVPPPLVASLDFVGRSAVVVEGSGATGSPDARLARAASAPADVVPELPLDAVGVLVLTTAPETAGGNVVLGATPNGTSGVSGTSAWYRIGDRWWAYRLDSVTLAGALRAGPTPSVWWNDSNPTDQIASPALALLTWAPLPFSSAISYGETLTRQIDHRWGTVCHPPVPAASQLWTFGGQPLGPSESGWSLVGLVWPDPPGSAPRSAPAERVLRVREPWRSGTPADALAPTEPARVVGDAVPCGGATDPADPLATWTKGLPGRTTAGGLSIDLTSATAALASGTDLTDLAGHARSRLVEADLVRGKLCDGRVLRCPWHEWADPVGLTERELKRLEEARAEAGWTPDALADAVLLDLTEPLLTARVLLVAPLERKRQVLLQQRAEDGTVLAEYRLVNDDLVDAAHPLPGTWVDPGGPWERPVRLAGRAAASVIRDGRILGLFLADLGRLEKQTTQLAIGWSDREAPPYESPVHVVALEAVTYAEAERESWDETVTNSDREAFETGLTHAPTDVALLVPGQDYTLTASWHWDVETGEAHPTRVPTYPNAGTPQTFRFRGASAAACPTDLAPWILDTTPGMGDAGIFCHDPLRIALSHQAVPELFAAYGRRLEVTVRSSSGHHPAPPGGGPAGQAFALPADAAVRLDAGLAELHPRTAPLQAWEQTAAELLPSTPCVGVDEVTRDTEVLTFRFELDPLTDYLLDIESVPIAGGARTRVYRANFTTSRFDSLAHLASWIAPSAVEHRLCRTITPLTALPTRPSGDQWDAAVQAAGLDVPVVPSAPRVEVWWSADPAPRPLAVVIEASEALYREHLAPTWVTGPGDSADPSHGWWAARPQPCLTPAGVLAPGAGEVTAQGPLVVAPGGTRVLAFLPANARGARFRLDLLRPGDPLAGTADERALAVDVALEKAPWEVED